MAANAITIPGAEEIEFYFSNGTYADAQAMPILKGKVVNELGKVFVKDGVGKLCKLMCDASGSSNTPPSRVFFSDSEGAASSDSVLIYDSINKKLGIGVSPAIGAKLHLHQASTANALIKLSNTTTGSGEHDGLNIGVVGDSYVVRTQYNRPIVVESENPSEPGQYLEIAKFQKTGSVSNTILNSDLKVNTIVAKSTAASVFLTHDNNTIKTRTATQVRADIGAAAVNHTQAISTITNLQDTLNNKQPLDTDLTAIAGLTHSNRHVMVSNGSSWTRRALEEADLPSLSISKITGLQTVLNNKQSTIFAGSEGQFYAWDKTMKAVDWTYVANKPSLFTPSSHGLVSSAHSVSGLTAGHFLKALSATTYGFAAITWSDIASKPSTFTPSAHTHPWSEITGKPSTYAPAAHTLVSHSDWSTYFDQALKTTSTPTFASINISNGGLINDWAHLGTTNNPSSPYAKRWYKAYELTGTSNADEDIELRVRGDVNYYYGSCIVRLKITRYSGDPANQLHVTITPISGWPSNALVKVDGGIVWVASNLIWGNIYGRFVQSIYNPGRVLFNTTYTETTPAGVSINGTFGVKTYNGDAQNVVFHDIDGANGNFTGQVNANNIDNTGFLQNTGYIASIYPLSDRSIHYRDVYQYSTTASSLTGTMKITLPKSWSSTMLTFTIKGYNYATGQGAWECIIGGYNGANWRNCTAEIRGTAPFSQVRLAHDGTKCCLLLGNTSTNWYYPQVAITEVFATYNNHTGWGEPYSMSFITSEDGITNIVTPTTSIYGNDAVIPNTALIGKTSTNKLNTGTFVRKTLSLNYTEINLDNETTWNFRIKTALTNSPAIFFNNAQEGDEVWVFNEYDTNSQPFVVMMNFNSAYTGITISPNTGLMLKCVGETFVGSTNFPAFVYGYIYTSGSLELKP
jgi:hypothetical protein